MTKRKIPLPPPGITPKGAHFDCSNPYCSRGHLVATCGMKYGTAFYNSFMINLGLDGDCMIQSIKDLDHWKRYDFPKAKTKGEEDPDFEDYYFPDPERDIVLRYALMSNKNSDNILGEESPNYPSSPSNYVPGEESPDYPWDPDLDELPDELPGEESPDYPWDPDLDELPDELPVIRKPPVIWKPPDDSSGGNSCLGESGLGCMPPDDGDSDFHSRPLPPSMGGTKGPPSKQAEQWVNWFLSQGEEGRRTLGFEKKQGIPRDPTQPIDPTPFSSGRRGGGGGMPASPVGPRVMTPVDDDNLPDSIKRRVAPLFGGIFPELDKKVPLVLSGGPRPIDPAGLSGRRPRNPRPIPQPGPVDPTIAKAAPTHSKKAGGTAFSSPISALQQMEDEWE